MRSPSIILLLFIFFSAAAQDTIHLNLVKNLEGRFSYVAPDGLGNMFAVTESGQLRKYNAAMDSVGVYNELKQLGRVHSIASFNALRTGVFFKQFKTLLVLDRFLREINRLDLRKAQLYQVNAVGQSFDNKWWVFDEQEQKLKKIGDDGKSEMETTDLRLLIGESIAPVAIFDQQKNVFVYDPSNGLFVFDQLGAFKKKIALVGWTDVQPFGSDILGVRQGKMFVYSIDKIDMQEYSLPKELKGTIKLNFTADGCYAMFADRIQKFKWAFK